MKTNSTNSSDNVFNEGSPFDLLGVFDGNKDGKVTSQEFTSFMDHSKDAKTGVMREIMNVFFSILGGPSGVVDVKADEARVPAVFKQAVTQVTGRDLFSTK